MFNTKVIKNQKYGRCLQISKGGNEMLVTLDFGPRIISFKRGEGQNILGEDLPLKMFVEGEDWKLVGGHRFWHGPESFPRTYIPDNDPVEFEVSENKVIIRQKEEKMTSLRKTIEISPMDEHNFKIVHKLRNNGLFDVKVALWAITVMRMGGVAIMPLDDKDTGFLPNRKFSIWPYTDIKDKRFELSNRFVAIRQQEMEGKLKIGIDSGKRCACYIEGEDIFIKRFDKFEDREYIDGGCNLEVYTDKKAIELETLSPIYNIKVGHEAYHEEVWEILKYEDKSLLDDRITDKDFEKIIDRYMDFR